MSKKKYTLGEIAQILGAELRGDSHCEITGIASLENAKTGDISFLVSSRYQLVASSRHEKFLSTTQASAVLLAATHADQCSTNLLIMSDPYQGLIKLLALFQHKSKISSGIHPSATISPDTKIAASAAIGPNCVIGSGCEIGDNTIIHANSVIGDNVKIGADTQIFANVTIYHDVVIGNKVIIYAGVVIGSEGFGMIRNQHGWQTLPHLGTVIIGDNVEIGANTTIDRGALDNTIIENGVKLDNLIMVGHGVVIGENTVIAGCVGIGGSTRIGKNCMIGGATGLNDNIEIVDNVIFTGMSQVVKSIKQPGVYSSGTGILPQKSWHKATARLHNLDELAKKLRKLEKEHNE
jgi:UDP-3-O-[3-hydroxymyristoyl] glucosamine N-acyltransferase